MTLYEFNILDFNNRMEAVNQLGIFLVNHISENEKLNLYAINKFFVEVVYCSKTNKITKLRSFKCGHRLDKYSIDFSDGI